MSQKVCPLCGGHKREGETTFTADVEGTLVIIRNVPATLCSLCGNEWLSDEVAASIENIVQEAKERDLQLEVTQYRQAGVLSDKVA